MQKKFFILILIFFMNIILSAQNLKVYIDQVITKDFPKMEVYVSVSDPATGPVMSLVPGNFTSIINGKKIESKMTVEGYQYSDVGIAYAILISANGLMEGEILAQQQKAVINLMETLKEKDTLSVYYFGEEVKTLFEFKKKTENLSKELSKIEILGSNPKLYDGLVFVVRRLAEAKERRKVLMLMSDGRDIESKYTRTQFLEIIDGENIPLYGCGIYLMGGTNLSNINNMANHTGGSYNVAMSPGNISSKLKDLNNQISHGYILKFKTNIKGDDKLQQIQIVVNKDGKEANFSKNFKAPIVKFPFWLKLAIIIAIVIILVGLVFLFILLKKINRKKLGITKRKCPECKRRMKDDWDDCPFCKYLPKKVKKKKNKDDNKD